MLQRMSEIILLKLYDNSGINERTEFYVQKLYLDCPCVCIFLIYNYTFLYFKRYFWKYIIFSIVHVKYLLLILHFSKNI